MAVPLHRTRASRAHAGADVPEAAVRTPAYSIGRGPATTLVGEPQPPSEPRPASLAGRPHRPNTSPSTGQAPGRTDSLSGQVAVTQVPRSGTAAVRLDECEARRLREHRKLRDKDAEMRAFVIRGLRTNRFCMVLEDDELDEIFKTAEYFRFEVGQNVIVQGEMGDYFFMLHGGQVQVIVNDLPTSTLGPGDAFGGVALLHHCPRTATVTVLEEATLWGVDGQNFRKVLQEHGERTHAENLRFLECISIFDGLTAKQKAHLCELTFMTEGFQARDRIITRGEEATAMYVLKKGELSLVSGGYVDASGYLVDGTVVQKLLPGDSFGWRAMLYGEPHTMTVIADEHCEVVCISQEQLKRVIGDNLVAFLVQSFIHHVVRQFPYAGKLPVSQRHRIVQAMEIRKCEGGERVDDHAFEMLAVIDGEILAEKRGETVTLGRGQTCTPAVPGTSLWAKAAGRPNSPPPEYLRAGAEGCRVAVLRKERLMKAFKEMGLLEISSAEGAVGHFELVTMIKKVPIFKELSDSQIDSLVNALILRRYAKNAQVFKQGEAGTSFFVIWSGTVRVLKDGAFVRTLGKGTCFGERALIFEDEQRSATVEVASDCGELWSIERQAFRRIVTAGMLKELQHRLKLQDKSMTLKGLRHVRLIGVGAFGNTRLVEELLTHTRYALKRIKKQKGQVPKEVLQEVAVLSAIAETEQPFMLRMVRTFDTERSFYILSEVVTRGSLRDHLPSFGGVLAQWPAQFYVASTLLALEGLQEKNIVHRCICPENIMLDAQGYIKLVDFGCAKKLDSACARTFTMVGPAPYMAPEVMRGKGYGPEADLWSLGVLLFELVCGYRPFDPVKGRTGTMDGTLRQDCTGQQSEIIEAVLGQDLQFPAAYTDQAGRLVIKGLLQKEGTVRLGNQMRGLDELKKDLFFVTHEAGDLFSKIINREVEAPMQNPPERWPDEGRLAQQATLSDAEDLGVEGESQAKIRAIFRKFDLNGDGTISIEEMRRVLKRLDFRTYTDEVIDVIVCAVDSNHDGSVDYDEFVSWILSTDAAQTRRAMHLEIHE